MAFGTQPTPTGLADPPIDDLMEHADSKYVGPLVEYQNQEKPLSIAFREINDGLLEETLGEDDLTEGN